MTSGLADVLLLLAGIALIVFGAAIVVTNAGWLTEAIVLGILAALFVAALGVSRKQEQQRERAQEREHQG